jgi:glycosyltransferase involved in cell wall biosynthesis
MGRDRSSERDMRVVIVGWAYDSELGDEAAVLGRYATLIGWSEAIRAAGVDDITVVQRFHRQSTLVRNGVTYRFCRDRGGPRLAPWATSPGVTQAVMELRPDLVHVNGLGFPIQTWRLRRRMPAEAALVVQDHASGVPRVAPGNWMAPMRNALRRRAMRSVDAYFFTASEQAEPWQQAGFFGHGQRIVAVAESSTTLRPVARDEARSISGLHGNPAVLWVGRLNANKDPLCIVDACALALAERPDLTLTMVYSGGDLVPAVNHRLTQHPGLAGRVTLVGLVAHDRLAHFYSAADVFVLGSHHEGSGYALIEACACGLPPAVTDIPSFQALTGRGAAGRLWSVGNAHACAAAIVALAADPSRERSRVRDHFERALSWEAIGREARAAYEFVVHDRRSRMDAAVR